ncbi:heme ABC exporter ATP-binding protein CcmA [Sulfitobacter guttiformis]|uniref:Heme exporter protein A n=1 Tax=Sulfitobacter guttiformis TaxID=74349 RepID=A0A420DJD0_9RHOB|nr:heme ABC exporter ATP-binding protein CcmA [Sulfitobacter guttiformis]KIN71859.1 Heme exporter protein CcmA [Sulfitobacter guttiformis KCTC 32187]RKE94327.1 heme exporter protein A [Sulfitobacter guttiformis]
MALRLTDVAVARGGVPVLGGVSFTLEGGEALILRGPNGSGKTTLLRTIAGLQPPLSGTLEGAADAVAYAGHADGLKSMLSVAENLQFWAAVYGQRDIAIALGAYGLEPLADRLTGTLSAGQKRRAGLARLMVTGRPIWVLDEPTVSLDLGAVGMFAAAVRGHLRAGGMALLATHIDLGLEAKIFDVSGFRAAPSAVHGASDEAFL